MNKHVNINKNVKITLLISLALNLFLIGFVLGNIFGMIKPIRIGNHGPENMFFKREEALIKSLPLDKQDKAKEILEEIRENRHKNFEESKPLLEDIEKIASAEQFDEAKFLEAFAKFDDSITSSKTESNKIIAKFLSELNVEERKRLIEEMKKGWHNFSRYSPENKEMLGSKLDSKEKN